MSSLRAMCSALSPTDQRSGAGLKFHCAVETGANSSMNILRVVCNWLMPMPRSCSDNGLASRTVAKADKRIRVIGFPKAAPLYFTFGVDAGHTSLAGDLRQECQGKPYNQGMVRHVLPWALL